MKCGCLNGLYEPSMMINK